MKMQRLSQKKTRQMNDEKEHVQARLCAEKRTKWRCDKLD